MLADGRLHLAGISKLAPHLTAANRDALLGRAVHKTKRQIEDLVAELAPRPDVPSLVRKLPERAVPLPPSSGPDEVSERASGLYGAREEAAPATLELGPDRVQPSSPSETEATPVSAPPVTLQALSPGRFKVQFTADARLREDLECLRALMRSEVPDGDIAAIIAIAIKEKRARVEARRHGAVSGSRKGSEDSAATELATSSRHVPMAVRRAVRKRDGGRCRYRDSLGRRCPERLRLEYHHRHPYGLGGGHGLDNVCLMCRAHNRYLAEIDYGAKVMDRHRLRSTVAHTEPT
jgi:hypothetical protein